MPSSLRDPLVRLRRTLGDTTRHELLTLADQDWYLTVGTLALVLQAHVTLSLRASLGDSVISEFIGLQPARGGRLYQTIGEVKLPVRFELAWLLASVASDVYTYHALALAANAVAVAVGAVAAAGLVRGVTDDSLVGSVFSPPA